MAGRGWGRDRDSERHVRVVGGRATGGSGSGGGSPVGSPVPGVVAGGRWHDRVGLAGLGRGRVEGGSDGAAVLVNAGQEGDRALGLVEKVVAAPEELDPVLVLGQGG